MGLISRTVVTVWRYRLSERLQVPPCSRCSFLPSQVQHTYTGPQKSALADSLRSCNSSAPVIVHITKQYPKADTSSFDAFGRVMSGTLQTGQRVRVLGEGYTPEDEEDMVTNEVTKLWIYQARWAQSNCR